MRVIITGGTGLIGRALANSLASDHHEVIVLSRNKNRTGGLVSGVKVESWDARSTAGWGPLADGADAIVNLAAESLAGEGFPPSRWTGERKKRIRESRISAGMAVTEAIREAARKPSVLIQASAVGYYGPRGDEDIRESAPAGSDFPANVAREWEGCTAEVEKMGVRRAVIRTGIVLTTKGGVLPMLALPFRLFAGGPIGSGKQQMPWIHLHDEIAAIRFLMDSPGAQGAYNLSAPSPVSNAQFAKNLGKVMRRPSFLPLPGFAFRLAFGELSMMLLEGQRAVPARLLEAGFQFHYPELEGALRDLFQNRK